MVESIADVGVVVALILNYFVQEMLVLYLACAGIVFFLELRELLEHLLVLFDVRHNLFGLEY